MLRLCYIHFSLCTLRMQVGGEGVGVGGRLKQRVREQQHQLIYSLV